jgi:hypothetical protein
MLVVDICRVAERLQNLGKARWIRLPRLHHLWLRDTRLVWAEFACFRPLERAAFDDGGGKRLNKATPAPLS